MNSKTNPPIVTCYVCGGGLSRKAVTCPHCAHPMQERGTLWWASAVMLGVLCAGFVLLLFSGCIALANQ